MFKTVKPFVTLAVIALSAGPALAHPGHGIESAVPGHLHGVSNLTLVLGAFAIAALGLFIWAIINRSTACR